MRVPEAGREAVVKVLRTAEGADPAPTSMWTDRKKLQRVEMQFHQTFLFPTTTTHLLS